MLRDGQFMTLELVIFIIVAAVAIFSAAFMLVSRNAVHSALFLVVNFLCVAFFYLMLNAPFLAMIQVTVYAGAIMVLFMFVIMLLGAEKLSGEQAKFPWLVPMAVLLTTVFLVVAFIAIIQGRVGLLSPVPPQPQIRFVNAAAGMPAADVYLNNDEVARDVVYREPTDFKEVKPGEYTLSVFPACESSDQAVCANPVQTGVTPFLSGKVNLQGAADTGSTFVITGQSGGYQLVAVNTDLSPVTSDTGARLTALNALPGTTSASLVKPNIIFSTDPDRDTKPKFDPIVPDLSYGEAKTVPITAGTYDLNWQDAQNARIAPVDAFKVQGHTHELLILAPELTAGSTTPRATVLRIDPGLRVHEEYGSPQQIGQVLFSTYLLPFELVSLLLLAAMVGAIILTREETVRRVRQRLVVTPLYHHPGVHVPANPRSVGTATASTETPME